MAERAGETSGTREGGEKSAVQVLNLCRVAQILVVDTENKAIVVKGPVPGKAGNVVEITPAKYVGKNC
jgi:ribosomal protein L3